jgi:hypothetical protein
LAVSILALAVRPTPPRFLDLYLIGMMLVTLYWSWRPAAVVFIISVVAANWILPGLSLVAVTGGATTYRMASYVVTASIAVFIIELAKRRRE